VDIEERSPIHEEIPSIRKPSSLLPVKEEDHNIMNGGTSIMMRKSGLNDSHDNNVDGTNNRNEDSHDDPITYGRPTNTHEGHDKDGGDDDNDVLNSRTTRNPRKLKAKLKKQRKKERQRLRDQRQQQQEDGDDDGEQQQTTEKELNIEIEYVHDDTRSTQSLLTDPMFSDYAKIFEKFRISSNKDRGGMVRWMGDEMKEEHHERDGGKSIETGMMRGTEDSAVDVDRLTQGKEGDENEDEEDDLEMKTTSHNSRKRRKRQGLTVAELKQLVKRSELVDWVDVTATDPVFLVHLKSVKNVVPVPQHWSQKRKYLQGKRGIVKPPFELPGFIRATGITELRESGREKEIEQSSKQKARAKVQPKMGKIEIDYQKLHDAFFRYQTKPLMTRQGDL
jgi:splicing factor 3B subunit 2